MENMPEDLDNYLPSEAGSEEGALETVTCSGGVQLRPMAGGVK